jgi:hypothetical protein
MSERSVVILTTFIDIIDHTGSLEDDIDDPGEGLTKPARYQNGSPQGTILLPDQPAYPDEPYQWLPFVYQGAGQTISGDNLTATLVLPNNTLSYARVYEAVINRYQIKVQNWLMNQDDPTSPLRKLTQEKWLATNFIFDKQTIEITLSSAIDAVEAAIPVRVLTQKMVGNIPVTGSIQNR